MRILGLDLGERRVGVALSDELGLIAQPLTTFEPTGDRALVSAVCKLVSEREVNRIVVGLPLNQDGSYGPRAKRVEALSAVLAKESGLPVIPVDERFTSRQASRAIAEAPAKVRRDKAVLDRIAAAIILQAYLDSQH